MRCKGTRATERTSHEVTDRAAVWLKGCVRWRRTSRIVRTAQLPLPPEKKPPTSVAVELVRRSCATLRTGERWKSGSESFRISAAYERRQWLRRCEELGLGGCVGCVRLGGRP